MRKAVALPYVALVMIALVAAGCGGKGNQIATASGTPTPFPSPSATCTPPAGYQVQEVFPVNGSTTAANLQGVVFAVAPNPLPSTWYVYATSTFGTTAGTQSIGFLATPVPIPGSTAGATPTPLPTPSDTPAFTPAFYETTSIGTFANNTTFQIYLANTSCFPGLPESSFTTTLTDSPTPTPTPSPTASPT